MMPGHWASTGGSTAHIRSASDNFSLMDSVPGLQSASSKASVLSSSAAHGTWSNGCPGT